MPGAGGEAGDEEAPPDEAQKKRQRQRHAGEPEFLGEHGEEKIRVRLGQVEELLHARAQSHAEPFAAADRDQRLRQLKAAVVRIRPGVEKRREAPQPVAASSSREWRTPPPRAASCRARSADARRRGTAAQSRWRRARSRRRNPAPRGAARADACQQPKRPRKTFEAGAQLLLAAHGVAGHVDQHDARARARRPGSSRPRCAASGGCRSPSGRGPAPAPAPEAARGASTSSGTEARSSCSVRTQKTQRRSARAEQRQIAAGAQDREKGSPLAWLAIEIDAEVTITRPSSTMPSASATITGSMRTPAAARARARECELSGDGSDAHAASSRTPARTRAPRCA